MRAFVFGNVTRDRGPRAVLEAVGSVCVLFWLSWRLGPILAGKCGLCAAAAHPMLAGGCFASWLGNCCLLCPAAALHLPQSRPVCTSCLPTTRAPAYATTQPALAAPPRLQE